jgi:hypothetical protein
MVSRCRLGGLDLDQNKVLEQQHMRAPQVLAKIRLFSGTAPFPRMPFIPVYPANTGTYQSTA